MPRAGNLLGTTRKFQPATSGRTFSPGRYARISGGVVFSLPGQNGQNPPFMATRSRKKSPGRLERSVEMITQRPVTGSFLSSGTTHILQLSVASGGRSVFPISCRSILLQFRFAPAPLQHAFRQRGRVKAQGQNEI